MSLLNLPTLEGARVIIIDEGTEAKYAESLITAWLPAWKAKDRLIEILCFSGSKSSSRIRNAVSRTCRSKVHDYYTLDIDHSGFLEGKNLSETTKIDSFDQNSIVIIDSLSTLILDKGLADTCRFVHELGARVGQLVCNYQRDFAQRRIPSIKTLGTSYVRLEKIIGANTGFNRTFKAFVSHLKPGGSVTQQTEIVEQDSNTYEMRVEKFNPNAGRRSVAASADPVKFHAPFRIEMNAREMEQRNATPLPYIRTSVGLEESKIHYEPDDVDDLDEEDPDDDLNI